ncbi:MAG: arylsulfatase [Planctomycetota bacterium]
MKRFNLSREGNAIPSHLFRRSPHGTAAGLLVLASLLPCWAALVFALEAEASRPNVLVILTDDQGWGDISLHGNPNIETPNIDSLARDGAQLKNFYVCAVCSPTRAEFLTGRYHARMGVFSTSRGGERFNLGERTIGESFRDGGYRTAAFGKWHSGMQAPYHPNSRGFDEFYGFCSGHWGNYFDPMLEHNGQIVDGKGFIIDDLTDRTIDFMGRGDDEPFFIYLPYNTPHSPMNIPDADWEPFASKPIVPDPAPENAKRQKDAHTRSALALVKNIDNNIGRILQALDEQGKTDNTIIVFFCDNGPNGNRFNGGLRGRKGSTHEGGLRSPCLIRYPDGIEAGTEVEAISGAIDLLPTLTSLARIPVGETAGPLDGVSMADHLTDADARSEPPGERHLMSVWNGRASLRSQGYRYHSSGQLFEITNDFGENTDIAGHDSQTKQELDTALRAWLSEVAVKTSKEDDARPFPLGHPSMRWTQLPSRDCELQGGVQRSNRFPNCTYVMNWLQSSDKITWNVEVAEPGTFAVSLYYGAAPDALGTRIHLRGIADGGTVTDQTVTEMRTASEPGFLFVEKDRDKRGEGYVKKWESMSLGHLTLPEGQASIELSASEIRGEHGVEMRLLMFERTENEETAGDR